MARFEYGIAQVTYAQMSYMHVHKLTHEQGVHILPAG